MIEEITINKEKAIVPIIVYKEVHGKLMPVKVYPTLPQTDLFDSHQEAVQREKETYNEYEPNSSIEKLVLTEFEFRLH